MKNIIDMMVGEEIANSFGPSVRVSENLLEDIASFPTTVEETTSFVKIEYREIKIKCSTSDVETVIAALLSQIRECD